MRSLTATGQCKTKEDVLGLFRHLGFDSLHAAWIVRSNEARWFQFENGMIEFAAVRDGCRKFTIRAAGRPAVARVHKGLSDVCVASPAFNLGWRCYIEE